LLGAVSRDLKLSDVGDLRIVGIEFVPGTCYRRVILEQRTLQKGLTVFLSPDQRFVTYDLRSIVATPSAETLEKVDRANQLLMSDPFIARGPTDAPVTIVEFGDYQCPYCKQFHDILNQLPPNTKDKFRLIYKNFPLPQHSWARDAAAFVTCAAEQSPQLFWLMHDFFFDQQAALTANSIQVQTTQFSATLPGLNINELLACRKLPETESRIDRDKVLGYELQVSGTPTIFINGVRFNAQLSVGSFDRAISEASRGGDKGESQN
jgi:protein-disulfide isomerase